MSARRNIPVRVLAALGCLLVVCACGLLAWGTLSASAREDESARTCARVASALDAALPAAGEATAAGEAGDLPVLQVAGVDVAGRISAGVIGLDLPVAAVGSDCTLVPALEDGREGELIVHGCTYQGALGSLQQLHTGDALAFTQVDGAERSYRVVDAGELSGEFDDTFDLLVYYEDGLGAKHWAGCSETS